MAQSGLLARAQANATLQQTMGERPREQVVWLGLLALPLMVPVALPGMSSAVGLWCLLVAFGVFTGQTVSLPAWLAQRPLNTRFADLLRRWHDRITGLMARFARPRWLLLSSPSARWMNAAMLAIAGLSMMAPVPLVTFDNVLPAAAIVLLTWGLRLRDGQLLLLGYLVTAAAVVSVALLWWGGVQAVESLLTLAA